MSEAPALVTFDEFVAREQASEARHEWVNGFVYAMAGGSERHDLMIEALRDVLGPGARSRGCRRFTGNRLVRTVLAGYYPDLLIVCGKTADRYFEADASLIVEVRSPSTADTDRREKSVAYLSLPSLAHYLLVDPYYRRVEVGTRGQGGWSWELHGPGDVAITPYGDLIVDDLYDEVDATATTT